MSLGPEHLEYPFRRHGMDHDRYAWSMLTDRKPVQWPGGARLALWINVGLQFYPLNQQGKPFKVPGGMTMPYPDLRHYSLRDYGNRVGIYRLIKSFKAAGVRATAAMNAEIATRYPFLLEKLLEHDWEIAASGLDMGNLHHGGVPEARERELVERSFEILRRESGQPVKGWFSPAQSQSKVTPDLVAQSGGIYLSDFSNDDAPYWMNASSGRIVSLPLTYELSDRRFLFLQNQPLDQWEAQSIEAMDYLVAEAREKGARMFSFSVTPWIIGQPYRMAALERVLERLLSHSEVWAATGAEIAEAWAAMDTSA